MAANVEDIEMRLLIDAILSRYGYDFRGYAEASLRRLVRALMAKRGFATISKLQEEVLHGPTDFAHILADLTVTTSGMFRDPDFYRAFREQVIPVLSTYSRFKIWQAGCSTGEEIYSLAILLEEAGLYERALIYATDINSSAIQAARDGVFQVTDVKGFTERYLAAGGRESFSSYYTAAYDGARFDPQLRRNVVFSSHSLATDEVFSEVHVVLCRNVLIYFDKELQSRALDLFTRSLKYKGFLCLGSNETVRFISGGDNYQELPNAQRIFCKRSRCKNNEGLTL